MTQPTGQEVFLVTLRVENGLQYIDITNERDVGLQLGSFGTASDPAIQRWVRRIERHLLVNWYSWYMLIEGGNVMAFDEACRQLVLDCMTRTQSQEDHDRWMAAHPLPAPTRVDL